MILSQQNASACWPLSKWGYEYQNVVIVSSSGMHLHLMLHCHSPQASYLHTVRMYWCISRIILPSIAGSHHDNTYEKRHSVKPSGCKHWEWLYNSTEDRNTRRPKSDEILSYTGQGLQSQASGWATCSTNQKPLEASSSELWCPLSTWLTKFSVMVMDCSGRYSWLSTRAPSHALKAVCSIHQFDLLLHSKTLFLRFWNAGVTHFCV